MIGEIAFREEQDRLNMLVRIMEGLHWAAPIVARSCRTRIEHIGFFGPRKVVRSGQVLWVYRLTRVWRAKPEFLRKNIWKRNAVLLDPKDDVWRNRFNHVEKQNKQITPFEVEFEPQIGDTACLG